MILHSTNSCSNNNNNNNQQQQSQQPQQLTTFQKVCGNLNLVNNAWGAFNIGLGAFALIPEPVEPGVVSNLLRIRRRQAPQRRSRMAPLHRHG